MSRFNLDTAIARSALPEAIADLESNQIEKQVSALEEATEIVNFLAIKAVDALRRGQNRFLIAERLNRFGSVIVPYLEELLKNSDNSEARILAAIVLLQLESRVGVPCLLDAVANNEDYAGLAASNLAKVGIKAAIEPIIKRLRNCGLKDVDLVVSLLDALAKLGGEIPLELRQIFMAADVPWQIRTIMEETSLSVSLR